MAEARTTDHSLQAGKWRMRLIGSLTCLPAPIKPDAVNSTFHNRELKDYYVPNERNCILRLVLSIMLGLVFVYLFRKVFPFFMFHNKSKFIMN